MQAPTFSGRHRLLLNLALVALFLRLFRLDVHSIWYDEAATWWNATRPGWLDTLTSESNHPPVWWIVTRAWWSFAPGAEAALRMPAVICGVIAVLLCYALARRLAVPACVPAGGDFVGGDPATPLWVAGFAAVNPFWIEYAQEARMYAALLAESLLLSLLYLRYLDRRGPWPLFAYALVATLALYTHYFAAFVVAGHAVHALLLWRSRRATEAPFSPWPLLGAMTVAGLLFVPWLVVILGGPLRVFSHPTSPFELLANALWRMGAGPALVALTPPRPEGGVLALLRDVLPPLLGQGLLWFLPIVLGLRALARDRGGRAFVLCCILVPIALALLASLRWTLVSEKYLIFVAPFLLYLAVVGALSQRGLARVALLGSLVLLHVAGLLAYHAPEFPVVGRALAGEKPYGKEQWRDLHRWVVERARPGDLVLVHAPFAHAAWDFYEAAPAQDLPRAVDPSAPGRVPALPLPPTGDPADGLLNASELLASYPSLARAGQVFLVLSHETTPDPSYYGGVVGSTLRVVQPERAWEREEVVFPAAWGVRVLHFHVPEGGP